MSRRKERFLSGVVEGFYGRPWTMDQRLDLFSRMSRWGMNAYLYAPKDDDKHRACWRELYSLEEADHLSRLIREATTRGINFIYAISPGLDITFSSNHDVALLKRKLGQVTALGCKSFAVLFDDIDCDMCPADAKVFPSFAHAQVAITNDVYSNLGWPETFLFCPTEYCASRAVPSVADSQYLKHLGEELHPTIDIMWTGPKVISKTISVGSIDELAAVLKRPPVVWDNLHANDYDQRRLFLGPYVGRSVSLLPRLNGVLTNPNCEYSANYVALHTLAQWSRCVNVLEKRSSPTQQAMQLEVKGLTASDIMENGGATKSSKYLDDLHLYDPKLALEIALKEWIHEFKVHRKSAEDYMPAKDALSVAKAKDAEQIGSGLNDDDIDAGKSPPEIVPIEAELQVDPDECAALVANDPFTMEDLRLLVDFFYLPHQHGERALHILKEFCWLKENAPGYKVLQSHGMVKEGREEQSSKVIGAEKDGMRSDGEISEGCGEELSLTEANHWCDRARKFHDSCTTVNQAFGRLTAIPNRPLLYEFYQYMWDVKETTLLLDSYISWLEAGGCEVSSEHEPHMSRGGITAEMQRLLPLRDSKELFARGKAPKKTSAQIYSIRPYRPEDRDLVYQTCLETGNNGEDATHLFPNFPDLLGDRFVGPYITLSSDLSFVLEDSEGVCGYVLGALDSKQFYDDVIQEWLPTVLGKYPKPSLFGAGGEETSPEKELIAEFQHPKLFLPPCLQKDYPSHLHIDLMRRAQGQNIGGRMVKTIFATLKSKGSHGVHLEMGATNKRALKFYLKLGFTVLDFGDDPQGPAEDVLVLGREL